MHVFAAWFSQNTVKISLNRSKWYKVGKSVNVFSSGIGIDVLQMTQLISCWRCLLALAAELSRHIRQNECKQGKVLGSWSVPKQYRHLVVTSRSFKHHHEAIWSGLIYLGFFVCRHYVMIACFTSYGARAWSRDLLVIWVTPSHLILSDYVTNKTDFKAQETYSDLKTTYWNGRTILRQACRGRQFL